jgi:hypothetical protein
VADRSCADCCRFLFDDHGGAFGKVVTRGGRPVERQRHHPPPCHVCPKIPEGDPANPAFAVELDERSAAIYTHYRECKAVGRFPDDPLVRRHAALCQVVDEAVERVHLRRGGLAAIGAILKGG